ncbi:HNH endonuclease signature motif containing protein [Mycobacterium sp.]|uniref:HNH endonuclease signature motif containing protein n=1 Tax=Mycobacterium sp. TaxID=1785 RepID=UPI0025F390A1|nr:HNH endonuclease signature motif containing protein [Mycobacterium sp.]
MIERLQAAVRSENRAAGERLAVIGELDAMRLREVGERETWCTDTQEAITAEVAAALSITRGLATSYLEYSRAMRLRLPRVGALLVAGDIDYRTFKTIVYRTDLITDPDLLAAVDASLAVRLARWRGITQGRLGGYVDQVVARADRDAVRRRRESRGDREFAIWGDEAGLTEVFGRLITTDAHAVDARLDALAATVCADDPRTRNQRRADAMGAMAVGANRLSCLCGQPHCPAATAPVPSPVVIHVIAEQTALDGTESTPGSLIGSDALIPAELLADLARSATRRPLIHPGDAPPENRYVPSHALADFVRCRDLTCRFPGCDQPAIACDLDHTTPYGDGGATHASNLKALCRLHHLIKTFWGWSDRQLPDGTLIWTSPSGQTYVTTPGSAMLFPQLCVPTGGLEQLAGRMRCVSRTAMMPKRRRTRAQNRANYVAAQRRHNRAARQPGEDGLVVANDEPPPF